MVLLSAAVLKGTGGLLVLVLVISAGPGLGLAAAGALNEVERIGGLPSVKVVKISIIVWTSEQKRAAEPTSL